MRKYKSEEMVSKTREKDFANFLIIKIFSIKNTRDDNVCVYTNSAHKQIINDIFC